jgi:5-formyltetrahydrofolate cyclo-ligase
VDKSTLRKIFLQKRREFTANDLEVLSTLIAEQFQQIPLAGVKFIHTFYPIAGRAEVDTLKISDWIKSSHPEIKLVLSKSNIQANTLSHILWEEDTPLAMNEWGITEPETGQEVLPEQLDLVLVPLLVFDKKGNRIGYGKGFYDRFLSECRHEVLKVGLSFFEPVEFISDVNEFDIPLDICITPNMVWRF